MILEKHFKFDQYAGCVATNFADIEKYVEAKMLHFQDYNNWTSKQEHIALFQEMLNMVNEDIISPDIDTAGISHLLYHDKFDARKFVLYYDLVFVLGSIAYNTFDYDKNALNHTEDGQHGPINMGDMVWRGYCELAATKTQKLKAAYGSTLIFTTVLEAELKRKFKWILIDELSADVETKIRNGSYIASAEEQVLLDCLRNRRNDFDSVYATTVAADDLFDRAGVYTPQVSAEQKNLMKNKMTLNQLLQSNIFKVKAEPVFIEIMKLLFGTNNLNLRNDIAHGGFGYQNYYHTAGAALLYLMLNAVICDYWKL